MNFLATKLFDLFKAFDYFDNTKDSLNYKSNKEE